MYMYMRYLWSVMRYLWYIRATKGGYPCTLFKNWMHFFVVLLACKSVDRSTFCIIITLLPFVIEMLQYDWLWSGHMIIKDMFYIPIKLKPELARAFMTTWRPSSVGRLCLLHFNLLRTHLGTCNDTWQYWCANCISFKFPTANNFRVI
jgi:hypothetical protein